MSVKYYKMKTWGDENIFKYYHSDSRFKKIFENSKSQPVSFKIFQSRPIT